MRKTFLFAFILLSFCVAVFGQEKQSSKMAIWSADKTCDTQNSTVTDKANLRCDSFIVDGSTVYSINYNGIFYALSFVDDGNYLIADVYVTNNSGERIFVDTANSGIVHSKTEQDFLAKKESLFAGKSIHPENISNKILNRVKWANALAGVGASFQTQQATINTTDNKGNISQSVVTVPNTQAQTNVANQNVARANSATQQAQNILSGALLPNTVFDKSVVSGLVYFKRIKKAKFSLVFMEVDNTLFVFQLKK